MYIVCTPVADVNSPNVRNNRSCPWWPDATSECCFKKREGVTGQRRSQLQLRTMGVFGGIGKHAATSAPMLLRLLQTDCVTVQVLLGVTSMKDELTIAAVLLLGGLQSE